MNINLSTIDQLQFKVALHVLNDESVYLIQPNDMNCKWTQQNKIFRSSVWNKDGELISAGFPKFTNFGENPDNFPVPTDLNKSFIASKLDGSLLIVSKYKGQYILRTRGTLDASKLETGAELEIFKEKYLPILNESCNNVETWEISFLFEWLTASDDHTIVLKYTNVPDWILVGAINHGDYSLYPQDVLNSFAMLSGFKRPESFKFNAINELIDSVTSWKDKEGIVLYTNNGQTLHKIKSDFYKKLHAFKSNATLNHMVDLFFQFDMPSYQDFEKKLVETFDYECLTMVKNFIPTIYDAFAKVIEIENGIKEFVNPLRILPRKEAAHKILLYSAANQTGFCFQLLDNKPLTKEMYKKLIWRILEK